ncbi:hypothetical protein BDZ91DRAFT_187577 [Kalaharituber pfeilii]|nr:hypothetical protein BDZ91DRAFT_187577 [Kalaharituber pfeilii]
MFTYVIQWALGYMSHDLWQPLSHMSRSSLELYVDTPNSNTLQLVCCCQTSDLLPKPNYHFRYALGSPLTTPRPRYAPQTGSLLTIPAPQIYPQVRIYPPNQFTPLNTLSRSQIQLLKYWQLIIPAGSMQ